VQRGQPAVHVDGAREDVVEADLLVTGDERGRGEGDAERAEAAAGAHHVPQSTATPRSPGTKRVIFQDSTASMACLLARGRRY
jgi:hypothetical protein